MVKINYSLLTCIVTLSLLITGCAYNFNTEANSEEQQNIDHASVKTTDNSVCPVLESRNWHAWIDRATENEPRLNISGEVDLPTPGYKVEIIPGILDRRQPPAQRFSLSFTPPNGIVAQVITSTQVSYTMPKSFLEYRSIMIYCGEKLLVEIPDVTQQETTTLPID